MSGLHAQFAGRVGAFAIDTDFTLAPRGITALVGPSGSGKTTALRCIAGLTRLNGRLTMDNETWQDGRVFVPPHRRAVGMVFQEASLLSHLSVKGNLLYGHRRSIAPASVKLDEVVELLGLSALLDRSGDKLSGGERQRVAIGRALLSQPRLLLMDEPVSSLDGDAKADVLAYLDRLHRTLAIPMLYVSHDLAEVKRLADHMLVMREGRIVSATSDISGAAQGVALRTAAEQQLAQMAKAQIDRLAVAAILAGLDGD